MTSVNAQHEALLDALLKDYTNPQDLVVLKFSVVSSPLKFLGFVVYWTAR
jgi:hypothetical protein